MMQVFLSWADRYTAFSIFCGDNWALLLVLPQWCYLLASELGKFLIKHFFIYLFIYLSHYWASTSRLLHDGQVLSY